MTFHLLTIADTNDPSIGEGCGYDLDYVENMMEEAADMCGAVLEASTIRGEDFTYTIVAETLHCIEPGPNDVVVIWYSGHGFRTPSKKERWPYIAFPSSPFEAVDGMGTDEIFKLLGKHDPRLLIVMSDCCNSLIDMDITEHLSSRTADDAEHARRNYQHLFGEARGTILATSSQPGEYSMGTTEGGWFTMAFTKAMERRVWSSRKADWKTIMSDACVPMACDSNDTGHQTPIYDLNVGKRVRSWTAPKRKRRKKLKPQSVQVVDPNLPRRNLKLVRLGWLTLLIAACLLAGAYFERLPLAVDGSAAILAAFAAWRGYRLGFLETVGQIAIFLVPMVASLWLLRPAERLLNAQLGLSFAYLPLVLFVLIAAVLFALLRWGFRKIADGHHASLVDGVAGAGFGALLGLIVAYVAVLGSLWVGPRAGTSIDLEGSMLNDFTTSHRLFDGREFEKSRKAWKKRKGAGR